MNNLVIKLLAVFFPPVAVALVYGLKGKFWLNVVLTLIGWLPGAIHALIITPGVKTTETSTTGTSTRTQPAS